MMLSETSIREFLAEKHPAYDFEIRNGEYVLVSRHDFIASNSSGQMFSLINAWVRPRRLGSVSDSKGGYRYDDGDLLAPDVTFISIERMPDLPQVYALRILEQVVVVQSSSDRESAVRAKLRLFLEKGSTAAIYIDPRKRRFEIQRLSREPEISTSDDTVRIEDVRPGLRFDSVLASGSREKPPRKTRRIGAQRESHLRHARSRRCERGTQGESRNGTIITPRRKAPYDYALFLETRYVLLAAISITGSSERS